MFRKFSSCISLVEPHNGIHHFTDAQAMIWHDFVKKILEENGLQDRVQLDRVKNCRTFARRPKNSILGECFELNFNE